MQEHENVFCTVTVVVGRKFIVGVNQDSLTFVVFYWSKLGSGGLIDGQVNK